MVFPVSVEVFFFFGLSVDHSESMRSCQWKKNRGQRKIFCINDSGKQKPQENRTGNLRGYISETCFISILQPFFTYWLIYALFRLPDQDMVLTLDLNSRNWMLNLPWHLIQLLMFPCLPYPQFCISEYMRLITIRRLHFSMHRTNSNKTRQTTLDRITGCKPKQNIVKSIIVHRW